MLWIILGALAGGYIVWRFALGSPTISACWFYSHFHIYCPGCGGTRSVIALAHGQLRKSLYYYPAVPFTVCSAAVYLLSQTIWRIRGKRGWVLHYRPLWLRVLLILILGNCILRNVLWFGFSIPL